MGLLDQVLGQVLGQLGPGADGARPSGSGPWGGGPTPSRGSVPQAGRASSRSGNPFQPERTPSYPPPTPDAPHLPGGIPPGAPGRPGGSPGGGLGGLLGGSLPPIALAILALLASKHVRTGAGGYGTILHDMLTGRSGGLAQSGLPGGGGVLGSEAHSRHGSGGFLDEIGGMLGGGTTGSGPAADPSGRVGEPGSGRGYGGGASGGGLGGLLGGLVGGGLLRGGLGSLLEQFSRSGHGDAMESWIGPGSNREIAPDELGQALGQGTIDELSTATGLERDDLLSQLSQALPQVIDGLTPEGRLPNEDEESRWV
jgi:uncharacterized protein YidB (DUF937 family)